MTVAFGSALSSANINNNLVSKTADSTMAGVLDLNEASSGAYVYACKKEGSSSIGVGHIGIAKNGAKYTNFSISWLGQNQAACLKL